MSIRKREVKTSRVKNNPDEKKKKQMPTTTIRYNLFLFIINEVIIQFIDNQNWPYIHQARN